MLEQFYIYDTVLDLRGTKWMHTAQENYVILSSNINAG